MFPSSSNPQTLLKQMLVRPKDKIVKERVVGPVYEIKCEERDVSYICKVRDPSRLWS